MSRYPFDRAARRFGRADQVRLVGLEPVQAEPVLVGVNRDRAEPQFGGRPKHPNGDLRPVGNEQFVHGHVRQKPAVLWGEGGVLQIAPECFGPARRGFASTTAIFYRWCRIRPDGLTDGLQQSADAVPPNFFFDRVTGGPRWRGELDSAAVQWHRGLLGTPSKNGGGSPVRLSVDCRRQHVRKVHDQRLIGADVEGYRAPDRDDLRRRIGTG